jgi:hypothetical protein
VEPLAVQFGAARGDLLGGESMVGTRIVGEIDPLTRLAIRHGTDKWGPHFYTPVYHELFAPLRDRPAAPRDRRRRL